MSDDESSSGRLQPTMPTLRELATVLFRRRRVFVWVSGSVLTAAILYALLGTKYQANMRVLIRRGRADAPVSASENAPLDLTRMAITEEELNSEVELLRDRDVLRKVVEETGIGGRDWFHFLRMGEGRPARLERAARRLAQRLKVEPIKRTNLIQVSYAADDPKVAARLLQLIGHEYIEKHKAVHRPDGELGFFEQQLVASREHLEESKRKLLNFDTQHGVVSAGLQRDLTLQKLSEMDASNRQTQVELSETKRRVTELETQLSRLPERSTTQVRTSDNPELLKALKSSLLDLQLKRTQLLTKFEPNHRLVQEVDQQIAQAETSIANENVTPVRDETTDKDTNYEWAKAELQKAQVQLEGLEARAAATSAQRFEYLSMARHFGEDSVTQEDLLSNEKAALENYLLYVKKWEEARMDDALDERGIVNVAIAEQPVVPALPLWSTWSVIAFGFVVAGCAGTVAAFGAEYIDPSFRDPEDVLAYLNSPVLASLPKESLRRLSA